MSEPTWKQVFESKVLHAADRLLVNTYLQTANLQQLLTHCWRQPVGQAEINLWHAQASSCFPDSSFINKLLSAVCTYIHDTASMVPELRSPSFHMQLLGQLSKANCDTHLRDVLCMRRSPDKSLRVPILISPCVWYVIHVMQHR